MPSGYTDYTGNKIIDHIFRNQAFTPPATVYVALYTTLPTRSTSGTELTPGANGYNRVAVSLSAAAAALSSNSADLNFGPASGGNWGTIVGIGLVDASTGGNIMWFGSLVANRTVNDGTSFKIAAGDLDLDGAAAPA